ncbi:hypothetical protein F751_3973 [Auxenochlorella protothecoides]|uniref:Uncharacterized protein n=1 Tax=Auxenochlorella protothecoides TaxID=3075 RepID=A0A087SHT9_AUXPR|nr:hypothetical protein F751_3973 [Auxenochlorella protothecoides]KFM25293.1 hypothetical protein F751_3973 [Auxenochlorella protothecoides]
MSPYEAALPVGLPPLEDIRTGPDAAMEILAREAKFRELGLAQAEPQRPQRQPQPKRRKVALEAPTEPRRRSSRVQMLAGGPSAQDDAQAQAGNSVGGWLEPAEEPAPVWEDSALRHYLVAETCQEASASAPPAGGGAQREGPWADSFVDATGFSDLPCFLEARTLARAYSIDCRPGLVVAGGKGGVVALWGLRSRDACRVEAVPALLQASLHRGWVADVQFWDPPGRDMHAASVPWLVSAGNDGAVCLWDLGQTQAGGWERGSEVQSASPRRLAAAPPDLHSGAGVFSLHAAASACLTGAKDGSVAVCALHPAGALTALQRYAAPHAGRVVKSPAGVASVRWHPGREGRLLASTSQAPELLIHDLRAPREPVHCLDEGAGRRRLPGIYQPCFLPGTDLLTASSAGSAALSLHCCRTGATLSRGAVGGELGPLAAWGGDQPREKGGAQVALLACVPRGCACAAGAGGALAPAPLDRIDWDAQPSHLPITHACLILRPFTQTDKPVRVTKR